MKRYRMSIISLLLFGVVLVIAYIWHLYTEKDVPFQMLAALLGAAITVVITNLLLNSQTESEFDRQKMSKVYEEKIQIYHRYINLLCDAVQDHKISNEELSKLKFQLSLVALHTSKDTLLNVLRESAELIKDECGEQESIKTGSKMLPSLIKIANYFHDELYGNSKINNRKRKRRELVSVDNYCTFYINEILNHSLIYNSKGVGRVTKIPVVQKVDFSGKVKEWEKEYGWKKDEGNEIDDPKNKGEKIKLDILRFYKGDANSPEKYVEIRYEFVYCHYIIRGRCSDLNNIKVLHNLYGGYMLGNMWWKVLKNSPFAKMDIGELCNNFDKDPTLQGIVALMVEDIIGVLDHQGNDNN